MARYLCVLLKQDLCTLLKQGAAQIQHNSSKVLLRIAAEVSPLVALDADTDSAEGLIGINIEVSGCERLFKGEKNIIRLLRKKFKQQGYRSRICIAPSLGCAWALSRYGQERYLIVRQDQLRDALQELPVQALRLSPQTLCALEEINILRISEVLALSQRALRTRFDKELATRINQALGRMHEILTPLKIHRPRKLTYDFASPVKNRTQILRVSEKLLDELLSESQSKGEKLSQLLLELLPAKGKVKIVKNILFSSSSSRKQHVWGLLKLQIETISFHQAISSISLYSIKEEGLRAEHALSVTGEDFGYAPSEKELGELLDTLATQLGAESLCTIKANTSHIPEESFHYEALNPKSLKNTPSVKESVVQTERPSLLFHTPRSIRAMALLPDSPPFWLAWRNEKHQLLTSIGPERIAPPWWGEDEELFLTRDYFKVQLSEGSWLWIFRHLETSEWFAHGLWV